MATTRQTLLIRLQDAGDDVSWTEFCELYQPLMTATFRRYGVPADDCEDLAQELLIALLQLLPSKRYQSARGRFRNWLRTLAKNKAIDWKRRRVSYCSVADPDLLVQPDQDNSDSVFDREHRLRVVEYAMEAVRREAQPDTWQCFEKHVLQRESAASVGLQLNLTSNAVYVNAWRTLERVRAKCRQFGEDLCDEIEHMPT